MEKFAKLGLTVDEASAGTTLTLTPTYTNLHVVKASINTAGSAAADHCAARGFKTSHSPFVNAACRYLLDPSQHKASTIAGLMSLTFTTTSTL